MIDVLYRVRRGKNENLRYSLRSLANIPHGDVFIVGHPPAWVSNVHVITPKTWRTKWRALVGDLALACSELKGQRLLLIDDDMMVLSPRESVPVLHGGDLRKAAKRKIGAYGKTLTWTADYLEEHDIAMPLSYELHVPLEIDADAMRAVIEPALGHRRPLQARSLYGNAVDLGGTEAQDVKLEKGPMPSEFLSTSPYSWRHWQPQLDALFPTPSVYEA